MANIVKRLNGLDQRFWGCVAKTTIAVLSIRNWPLRLMKIQAACTSTSDPQKVRTVTPSVEPTPRRRVTNFVKLAEHLLATEFAIFDLPHYEYLYISQTLIPRFGDYWLYVIRVC